MVHLLQAELSSLLDAVQETETKMVEMSALNHLMSTHVLQQAQQIELLYEQVSGCVLLLALHVKSMSIIPSFERNILYESTSISRFVCSSCYSGIHEATPCHDHNNFANMMSLIYQFRFVNSPQCLF